MDSMAHLQLQPIYAVLFSMADWEAEYVPVLDDIPPARIGTFPHQLDLDVVSALSGIHFAQHLPRMLFELGDFPTPFLLDGHRFMRSHAIRLLPVDAFSRLHIEPSSEIPILTIAPDEHFDEASVVAESLGFQLQSLRFSDLTSGSLQRVWEEMQSKFLPSAEYRIPGEHIFEPPNRLTPASLPLDRLYRQMHMETKEIRPWHGTEGEILKTAFSTQKRVSVLGGLELEGFTLANVEETFGARMADARFEPRVPMTLAFPGVAPAHKRKERRAAKSKDFQLEGPDDRSIEESAISVIATHRTLAQDSVGLVGPEIPNEMFVILAELEKHWTLEPRGKAIRSLLRRLNKAAERLWTEDIVKALHRASSLSVLSNFPVGLLTLPGDTSPLCCRLPISNTALLPLTRTLQSELTGDRHVDLTNGFKVLVVECIPATDPVGRLSRTGWESVESMYAGLDTNSTVERVNVESLDQLRAAIGHSRPDILVLSAHGFNTGHMAGIVVGNEPVLAQDLGPVPPVVIMSACHVSPRGRGEISIVDLLERQGAVAVLGTQVPVDVRRNALLMGRFFLYLNEVVAGRGRQKTVLEVWQHVQCLNTVNDIAASSIKFGSWIMGPHLEGASVLEEFMMVRSRGGIRGASVYEDTERLLLKLAEEQGIIDRVRGWMATPGYIPESLFYHFMGRPGNVWLSPPSTNMRDIG